MCVGAVKKLFPGYYTDVATFKIIINLTAKLQF